MVETIRMRTSWTQLHRSIVSLAVGAIFIGAGARAWAGRPVEGGGLPGSVWDEEAIDLENFGLLPRWTAQVRILHRSDEALRSFAVFRLSQVVAPRPPDDADQRGAEKPGFRVRLPEMREPAPGEPATDDLPPPAAKPPALRAGALDLRERDLAERPTLLHPFAGSWLGDVEMMPIQTPSQPQVIPPPIPPPDPEMPTLPGAADIPKPELFPSADSPSAPPPPIPWETSRGSRVTPVEPEPETEPKPPAELKLKRLTSPWDLAELEGPLFGTEEIAEFTRKITATGAWAVLPHLSTTALYDGNVFLSEAGQESDFIITVSPGVTGRIGNEETQLYLLADYTLGAVFFTQNDNENSFNHNARLELDWRGARSSLGLRFGLENDSGTSIDATDRVRRSAYSLGVETHFAYSDKVSFDANADYHRAFYENLIGSEDFAVQGYVTYHYSPKLSLGVGGGGGVTQVESGRTQTSENFSLRADYVATGKVTLEGNIGVGFYQFDNGEPDSVSPIASLRATYVATGKLTFSGDVGVGVNRFASSGSSLTPTFGLEVTWAVWEGTVFSANVHRRIFNSVVFSDQNYTSTGIVISLQQQLGIRFTAFLTAGYENLHYTSAGRGVTADRDDDYFFARFGLQWHAFGHCSFGVFYEFSENSSSGATARDFRRDRVGTQVSITF